MHSALLLFVTVNMKVVYILVELVVAHSKSIGCWADLLQNIMVQLQCYVSDQSRGEYKLRFRCRTRGWEDDEDAGDVERRELEEAASLEEELVSER